MTRIEERPKITEIPCSFPAKQRIARRPFRLRLPAQPLHQDIDGDWRAPRRRGKPAWQHEQGRSLSPVTDPVRKPAEIPAGVATSGWPRSVWKPIRGHTCRAGQAMSIAAIILVGNGPRQSITRLRCGPIQAVSIWLRARPSGEGRSKRDHVLPTFAAPRERAYSRRARIGLIGWNKAEQPHELGVVAMPPISPNL
jgi:hypothetical protein